MLSEELAQVNQVLNLLSFCETNPFLCLTSGVFVACVCLEFGDFFNNW